MTTTGIANTLSNALGINTGIDTTSLVSQLTSATFQPKLDQINQQISNNTAQLSAIASAKSSLDTFSSALTKLLQSSAYAGQPGSTDPTIASVTAIAGGTPTGLPAQIEVQQLATAQVLQSVSLADGTAVAGTGTLTLTVGANSYDITLSSPSDTLTDLASAINATKSGVTASIVTDNNGSRLVLKGTTGAANAFTLTAGGTADTNLQRFSWDGTAGGMTQSQTAQNAQIAIDNVNMEFSTNTVTTAIPYLSIDLNKAAPGTSVTIATDQPTSSMADLVQQIVDAYNTFKTALNTATQNGNGSATSTSGLLANDSGARDMANRMARLVSTQLTPDGTYKSLNDLGVSTNRDGTLSLDTARLNAALQADPAGVVQMLNPTVPDSTHTGIAGALSSIVTYIESDGGPLNSSQNTYKNLATNLQKQIDKVTRQESDYSDQLTATYSAMQSTLLQLKATQTYITQQVAVWTNKTNG